ncbi:amidohydrolase family protein [Kangiella sp. TOML190]|uniref:amidohydrolase family protein n=1 Tax=Kangiella sp. TOML190 TaxID=2931351 RepID=UPI00203A5A4D|nr:amidohydrolase family protein [Kangiella sp. TOML190]
MSKMFKKPKVTLAVAAMFVLGLSACDNSSEQSNNKNNLPVDAKSNNSQEMANSNANSDVSPDNSETVAIESLQYNIFNKEDTAGTYKVEKDGNFVKANLSMGWNNRRIESEETLEVDEQGFVVKQQVKGISAFGAPIDESYSFGNGVATWNSLNESGEAETDGKAFYVPIDGTGASNEFLVKALAKDPDNKIDLLPSGTASLVKLDSVTLNNGTQEKKVHLIGIAGFGFTPDFAWYDDDYNFFATDGGGWFGVIPEGWGREHLEQLSAIQKRADNDYLKDLAQKLTHTVDGVILINNVNYVDVEKGELVKDQSIMVRDGKIFALGRKIPRIAVAKTIDAKGKTLIPGLWDMHGHLQKSDGLLNIPAGVTNVRDMGNTHDNIVDIERMSEANEIMGGDVYRSGFMDRESPYAMKMGKTVDSLEAAKAAVDWYAEQGYPQIKTYSSMEPEWVKPLAEHIHSKGMKLSGHIPAFMTAEEAVDAGFDEIQHINMLFLNFMGSIDTRKRLRFTMVGEQAGELDLNSKEVEDFIAKLKTKGTVIDATLSVFKSLFQAKAGRINPEVADIYDHLPVTVARNFKTAILDIKDEERAAYDKSTQALGAMVKKLHDSGVKVVAGTDGIAGFTLHQELIDYAQAGISNADVLKIATIDSANVVGAGETNGSIAVGKQADLVFVDGNPLEDMQALRNISLVIKGQNLYKPDEIYQAIGVKPFTQSIDIQ